MSFPIIKKYPHHSDLIFCRVPVLHTFPDNILAKYSREKYSYTEVHVFSKHNTFLGHFQFLICHALARAPGTEKGKKTKGTHFSTGPTTSSRHSKKYPHHSDLIFCRVPFLHTFPDNILTKYSREKLSYTEVHVFSKHNTFLGHFQFLICHALARAPGTEKGKKKQPKTKGTHFSTGPTTSSRHSKNLKLQTVPPPIC